MDVVAFILCVIFTLIVDEFSYYPIGLIQTLPFRELPKFCTLPLINADASSAVCIFKTTIESISNFCLYYFFLTKRKPQPSMQGGLISKVVEFSLYQ